MAGDGGGATRDGSDAKQRLRLIDDAEHLLDGSLVLAEVLAELADHLVLRVEAKGTLSSFWRSALRSSSSCCAPGSASCGRSSSGPVGLPSASSSCAMMFTRSPSPTPEGVQRRLLRELALLRLIGNIQRRHRVVGRSSLPARPRSGDPGHRRRRQISPAPKISPRGAFPAISSPGPRFRIEPTATVPEISNRRVGVPGPAFATSIPRHPPRYSREGIACRRGTRAVPSSVHFRPSRANERSNRPLSPAPSPTFSSTASARHPPTSSFFRAKSEKCVVCHPTRTHPRTTTPTSSLALTRTSPFEMNFKINNGFHEALDSSDTAPPPPPLAEGIPRHRSHQGRHAASPARRSPTCATTDSSSSRMTT